MPAHAVRRRSVSAPLSQHFPYRLFRHARSDGRQGRQLSATTVPCCDPSPGVAVFTAISNLLEQQEVSGAWIPPKLAAAFYGVLHRLPEVHFETAVNLAGRTGIGLSMIIEGYIKKEIVIDPATYLYMGQEAVVAKDHTVQATDGTDYFKKGQILGWDALLVSAIVTGPGQLP